MMRAAWRWRDTGYGAIVEDVTDKGTHRSSVIVWRCNHSHDEEAKALACAEAHLQSTDSEES